MELSSKKSIRRVLRLAKEAGEINRRYELLDKLLICNSDEVIKFSGYCQLDVVGAVDTEIYTFPPGYFTR